MSVPFLYVNGTLNLMLNGKMVQVTPEHPSYGVIKSRLATATADELIKLTDVNTAVHTFVSCGTSNRARVDNGTVYFDNKPIHNALATRIVDFMKEGLPFKHLLKFMENIEQNPSCKAKEELFDFLSHKSLPITEDGCFLAYKAVSPDYTDKHTGKVDNHIGAKPWMKRNDVDDDRENGCSRGYHAGSLEYISIFGNSGDHLMIVKIHPADVVSVPKDYSFQKLRCNTYEVVDEYTEDLVRPLYTTDAKPVTSPIDDDEYDWDWADEDEDEDEWEDEVDDEPLYTGDGDYWSGCHCKTSQPRDSHGRFSSNKVSAKPQPKRDSRGRFSR